MMKEEYSGNLHVHFIWIYLPMNNHTSRMPKVNVNILDKSLMYNSLNRCIWSYSFFFFFLLVLWDQLSLCSPDWPKTQNPSMSGSMIWAFRYKPLHLVYQFFLRNYFFLCMCGYMGMYMFTCMLFVCGWVCMCIDIRGQGQVSLLLSVLLIETGSCTDWLD